MKLHVILPGDMHDVRVDRGVMRRLEAWIDETTAKGMVWGVSFRSKGPKPALAFWRRFPDEPKPTKRKPARRAKP